MSSRRARRSAQRASLQSLAVCDVGKFTALGSTMRYRPRRKAARREPLFLAAAAAGLETVMFSNVPGPTAIDIAGVSALGQALVYREYEDARRSDIWREELTQ